MERNQHPPGSGTPTPLRTNRILAEPATPQRCADDYAEATDHRALNSHRRRLRP
jgi:hypothetical protein